MKIEINNKQREFILKCIWNITSIYDFENTTEKEFKETYGLSKLELQKEINNLRGILKNEK